MLIIALSRPEKSTGKSSGKGSSADAREKIIVLIKEEPTLTLEKVVAALGVTIDQSTQGKCQIRDHP